MGTKENVMSRIGIAPEARRRWQEALEQFARQATDPKYQDERAYPEEQAAIGSDGLLELQITFEDGAELAMKFSPSEWCWTNQASTGGNHGVQ